jgi:hypothetical protein
MDGSVQDLARYRSCTSIGARPSRPSRWFITRDARDTRFQARRGFAFILQLSLKPIHYTIKPNPLLICIRSPPPMPPKGSKVVPAPPPTVPASASEQQQQANTPGIADFELPKTTLAKLAKGSVWLEHRLNEAAEGQYRYRIT